jgi:hypothetical protein
MLEDSHSLVVSFPGQRASAVEGFARDPTTLLLFLRLRCLGLSMVRKLLND